MDQIEEGLEAAAYHSDRKNPREPARLRAMGLLSGVDAGRRFSADDVERMMTQALRNGCIPSQLSLLDTFGETALNVVRTVDNDKQVDLGDDLIALIHTPEANTGLFGRWLDSVFCHAPQSSQKKAFSHALVEIVDSCADKDLIGLEHLYLHDQRWRKLVDTVISETTMETSFAKTGAVATEKAMRNQGFDTRPSITHQKKALLGISCPASSVLNMIAAEMRHSLFNVLAMEDGPNAIERALTPQGRVVMAINSGRMLVDAKNLGSLLTKIPSLTQWQDANGNTFGHWMVACGLDHVGADAAALKRTLNLLAKQTPHWFEAVNAQGQTIMGLCEGVISKANLKSWAADFEARLLTAQVRAGGARPSARKRHLM